MSGNEENRKYRLLLLGEKESFLIRVLLKKLNDSGFDAVFSPFDITGINDLWEGTDLVVSYMDTDVRLRDDIFRFLTDKMTDSGIQIAVICDKADAPFFADRLPKDLVYKVFYRPLDNDEFIKSVSTLMDRIEAGEYRKSVLVVDDDPSYLGVVREWLKDSYKVSMVSSGLQAIKWLGKNKADLILLDHEMPVTTGPQVLEMLRSDPETASIPVIFLTGKSDRNSVMAVVALKPEGYFLKNIDKEELLGKLAEFFEQKKAEIR